MGIDVASRDSAHAFDAVRRPAAFSAAHLSFHDNAVIMPLRRGKKTNRNWDAGIFAADGTPIPNGALDLHKLHADPAPHVFAEADATAEPLAGRWLFAGVMPRKTGHIVLNALGRLWATDHLPEDVGLLYVPHLFSEEEHPFLTSLLRSLGQERPVRIVNTPARVEQLIVGPDGFSSASFGAAHPQVAKWVRARAIPEQSSRAGRRLYITRGRLSPLVGRYLCEDILEENLEAAGYEVIVPEALPLRAQLDLYAEASEVIAAEGTAVHIAALAVPDTARMTVIQRRHEVPDLIANHLDSFLKRKPIYLDAVADMHWPEERAVNVALTTLDFDLLRKKLIARKLIAKSDPWRMPTPDEVDASRGAGRAPDARFLTLSEREAFLREFRRRRRRKRT